MFLQTQSWGHYYSYYILIHFFLHWNFIDGWWYWVRYWVHSNYLILAEYSKNYFNLITRFFKKDNSKQDAKLQDSGNIIHQKNQTLKKNFSNYDQSILPIMINKHYVVNKESQISEYNIWLRWDVAIRIDEKKSWRRLLFPISL